jgi:hypothetical protein
MLGLIPIVHEPPRYARFRCPDSDETLSIEVTGEPTAPCRAQVYLECRDLDAAVSGLKETGLVFDLDPTDMDYLWREARLRDPDGHDIRLYYAHDNRLNPPWKVPATLNRADPEPAGSMTGGCACGAVRYAYRGDPILSYLCYCLDCQHASGGGSLAIFWARADRFRLLAGPVRYREGVANSGRRVARGFCCVCAAPVIAEFTIPGVLGIIASSLDEPARFQPTHAVWTSRARPWNRPEPSLVCFEENFPLEVVVERLKSRH